ncbi:MAG TPA: MMPL family transporter [Gaiellaceae bacterium]|nr:MMPL family transporter [Gaiellaceae bacterium]
MPEQWTRGVLRLRIPVLACWLAILVVGVLAAGRLPALLSNTFTVPGTDSDRARVVLARDFGERPDGVFTVVFRANAAQLPSLQRRVAAAARAVPGAHASLLRSTGGVAYGEIDSTLDLQHAKGYTPAVRRALAGTPRAYVTGQPAIQHDLEPVLASDLRRGEAIALPIALAVLVAVLGLSLVILVPFLFAACTITAALALVYAIAQGMTMVSYVTNLVELVGLGLAIDYSLLVVFRFREELEGEGTVDDAIVRTMGTAGRAVMFSGATVAIGLGLLLFVPVPFVRSLGIGGFLVPLASIAAAATLQPALLSLFGRKGTRRVPVAALLRRRLGVSLPVLPGTLDVERGFWARLARAIMRRPLRFLAVGATLLVSAAVPAFFLQVTPGSISALPHGNESVDGMSLLRSGAGAGALTPTELVIDTGRAGGAHAPAERAAIRRLANLAFHEPEALITASGPSAPYVDRTDRFARVYVVGRHEYGDEASQALVRRLRRYDVPRARFPAGTHVWAGGGPPQGVDYLDRSYGWFPWLVLGALALTYLVLLRAFRSVLLPLKAVVLNLLSVAAVYGLLVVIFRWGVGADVLGLYRVQQIEGWIPIFLFAMLFGLSMDYEVFLVTRMRESWDEVHDNARAVAHGLERTGRIVTAAALIMVAAFSGFVAGNVAGLQEFGAGLALAILIDATLVRAILVPSLMAVFGRWNWWLPGRLAWLAPRSRPGGRLT